MNILALDIGGTYIKVALVDENANIICRDEVPTKYMGDTLINKIIGIIAQYKNINKIGISSAGQINPQTGKVIFASDNLPGWTGVEIKKILEDVFKIPVSVENDVNCAAIGEAHFGAAKDSSSFLCLTYGTGIGGAIIENGKVYTGATFSAGEFGHIITNRNGLKCTCGGIGCYEAYASVTALVKKVAQSSNYGEINGKEIFRKLNSNDLIIKSIVDEWIEEVIVGLISLIYIFNPSLIVLGGGIMEQEYVINYINHELYKKLMPSYRNVKIKNALLGNDAGLLGAAYLTMEGRK